VTEEPALLLTSLINGYAVDFFEWALRRPTIPSMTAIADPVLMFVPPKYFGRRCCAVGIPFLSIAQFRDEF
jgi:hypothetical protein